MAVCAEGDQRLALRSDGTVAPWGAGVSARLSNVIAIATGQSTLLGLKPDGSVSAWPGSPPVNFTDAIAIAAGRSHNLVLRVNGQVHAWGDARYNQIYVPADLTNAVAVAGGPAHSLALRSDGGLIGWGDNTYGQLNIPSDLHGAIIIACGVGLSLALIEDTAAPNIVLHDNRFGVGTNGFGFNITGSIGQVVVLEVANSLANPIWSPVSTNTLTSGTVYFSEPQWMNYLTRFYRLRSP